MLAQTMHGKPLIYLDSAATTHKPQAVIDRISRFYATEYGTVHRAVYDLATQATRHYDDVRKAVQRFLNAAHVEEIVFTRGSTDGINLVARALGYGLRVGDEILISAMEHHSNIVPWQMVCRERGAELKVIPINDRAEIIIEEYEKLLSEKTKVVAIAHIVNSTGTENPIQEMVALAHRHGAKVVIDGAQSAAHLPVDVQSLDADFFVFSGHKIYGPTGVGILYGKRRYLEEIPPIQGGGDMIETVTFAETVYQPPPLKFEAGTPMVAEVLGLGEALRWIEAQGRDQIAAWEKSLLEYATAKLQTIPGIRFIGTAARKGPIISFVIEGLHPLDIGTLLDLRGIAVRTGHHCAQPLLAHFGLSSTVRLSFGAYNTFEDIDICLDALQEILLLKEQISRALRP